MCFREKADEKNPAVSAAGFFAGGLHAKTKATSELVLPWHESLPLSKSVYARGWRFMGKLFSGIGFAATPIAGRCSGFAPAVIAASGTAARSVVVRRGASSIVPPIAGISKAPKGGWIIATGNAPTVAAAYGAA